MVGTYAKLYNQVKGSNANIVNDQLFDALDNVGVSPQESFAFVLGIFATFTAHGVTRMVRQRLNRNRPDE